MTVTLYPDDQEAPAMHYLWLVWQYWVSLFPDNEVLGSRFNTAVVAMVLMFTIAGWVLGHIFGKDPGVK